MEELQIELEEVSVIVVGYYTPKEPTVMYYSDMSGHPGSPAEFEIEKIYLPNDKDEQDITNLLSYEQQKIVQILALDELE